MWIQNEEWFLAGLTNVTTKGFIIELLRTRLIIAYEVSLVVFEIIEWVSSDVSGDGDKCLLRLGSSGGTSDGKSRERYGGTSDDKRPGGEFRILLVSNIGTDDGIWLVVWVELTVGGGLISLIILLVNVLFGWSLRKYFESLIGIIPGTGKVFV